MSLESFVRGKSETRRYAGVRAASHQTTSCKSDGMLSDVNRSVIEYLRTAVLRKTSTNVTVSGAQPGGKLSKVPVDSLK